MMKFHLLELIPIQTILRGTYGGTMTFHLPGHVPGSNQLTAMVTFRLLEHTKGKQLMRTVTFRHLGHAHA